MARVIGGFSTTLIEPSARAAVIETLLGVATGDVHADNRVLALAVVREAIRQLTPSDRFVFGTAFSALTRRLCTVLVLLWEEAEDDGNHYFVATFVLECLQHLILSARVNGSGLLPPPPGLFNAITEDDPSAVASALTGSLAAGGAFFFSLCYALCVEDDVGGLGQIAPPPISSPSLFLPPNHRF